MRSQTALISGITCVETITAQPAGRQPSDLCSHVTHSQDIKPIGRFVEQDIGRLMNERPCERNAATLAQ